MLMPTIHTSKKAVIMKARNRAATTRMSTTTISTTIKAILLRDSSLIMVNKPATHPRANIEVILRRIPRPLAISP